MTEKAQSGTVLKRNLMQKIAAPEYHVLLLVVFLRGAWYGSIKRLACPQMVSECESGGALLNVPLGLTESWYAPGTCRLLRNMVMDPVSGLVAIGRLTEIDLKAISDQDWFPCKYKDGKIKMLPEESPFSTQ